MRLPAGMYIQPFMILCACARICKMFAKNSQKRTNTKDRFL
jgi:hypothetical protein